MRKLLLALLSMLSIGIFSQSNYRPLVSQSKSWTIKTCFSGICNYDGYFALGDTFALGHNYTALNGFHYNRKFFLREDTLLQQVFLLTNIDDVLKEYLLYDFSLQSGDSIYLENPVSPATNSKGYYTVDSIEQKTFFGISRRFFHLSANNSQNYHQRAEWIEGIGSTAMINTPGAAGDSAKLAVLTCVIENGTQIYNRLFNDSCTVAADINNSEYLIPKNRLWFDGQFLHFQFPKSLETNRLSIYNINGVCCDLLDLDASSGSLDLSYLEPGIYLLCSSNEENTLLKIHVSF